jgi:type IV pilus assembly protein PilZ
MLLFLPNDTTKYTVAGRVAWVMPAGAHKLQGVGIQFNDSENRADILGRIENLLGGTLTSPRSTHTM